MADQLDKIDAYLKNKLSKSEKESFEQQMSTNPSLMEAVQQQRKAIQLIEALGDQQLKLQLKQAIQNKNQTSKPAKRLTIRWRTAAGIAASLLVLAIALWFIFAPSSNDALFATNYEIYNLSVNSRDNSIDQSIRAAVDLYQKSQFEEALPLLDGIYQSTNDSKWRIAQAVSLIETEQYQRAIDQLSAIRSNGTDVYQNPALWYTAMAYLKLDQKEQAITNIELLSQKEPDIYTQKARAFLDDI